MTGYINLKEKCVKVTKDLFFNCDNMQVFNCFSYPFLFIILSRQGIARWATKQPRRAAKASRGAARILYLVARGQRRRATVAIGATGVPGCTTPSSVRRQRDGDQRAAFELGRRLSATVIGDSYRRRLLATLIGVASTCRPRNSPCRRPFRVII